MTAPNADREAEPCGCTDALLCIWHANVAHRKGLTQEPGEMGRQFLRRVLATNPTMSQRVAQARRSAR